MGSSIYQEGVGLIDIKEEWGAFNIKEVVVVPHIKEEYKAVFIKEK